MCFCSGGVDGQPAKAGPVDLLDMQGKAEEPEGKQSAQEQ